MTEPGRACITCNPINQWCDQPCPKSHNKHRYGTPTAVESSYACGPCVVALTNLPGDIAVAYCLLDGLEVPGAKTGDGRSKNPEAPLPLVVDPVDLTAEWRLPQGPIRLGRLAAEADMQYGHMPVRSSLGTWVAEWCERRGMGEVGPALTVPAMCDWLTVRTDWAVEHHPGLDEYAAQLVRLRTVLHALVGQPEPDERPQQFPVPCPRCHRMSLVRRADMAVECKWPDCARVYSETEWTTVSKATANAIRRGQIRAER
jgi:hypothetical protein